MLTRREIHDIDHNLQFVGTATYEIAEDDWVIVRDQALRVPVLVKALKWIRRDGCENFTSGLGSCFRNGRTPDAQYGADRCCAPCVADTALRAEVKP